jgi:hypothetical protein
MDADVKCVGVIDPISPITLLGLQLKRDWNFIMCVQPDCSNTCLPEEINPTSELKYVGVRGKCNISRDKFNATTTKRTRTNKECSQQQIGMKTIHI